MKLTNFSIVNGGQTSYIIWKSKTITENYDFFLPCKIIRIYGDTEDEKNQVSLEIAKATNSQKAIKQVDLKANAPEQVRFARAMREVEIFYRTKRGESIPRTVKEPYQVTHLLEVGKLCLCAIFQLPCTSRQKPSTVYLPKYYNLIFDGKQDRIARISKELLYINYYYTKTFLGKFDHSNTGVPYSEERISFAHNARTICIAFVALTTRYYKRNISDQVIGLMSKAKNSESAVLKLYDALRNLEGVDNLLPKNLFNHLDRYDLVLDQLFSIVIDFGVNYYLMAKNFDPTLTATNYLKRDKSYYEIIGVNWTSIKPKAMEVLEKVAEH